MISKSISPSVSPKGRRIAAFRLAVWFGFLLMPFLIEAQTTLYWDGNGTTAGTGGTNTWTTSTSTANRRWRAGSATGTLGSWSNSDPTDYAVFGGTAGTVSWASNISVRRITFTVSGYTLARTSNTLTLVTDGFIDTGSFNATISGPLAGTVGMTKLGSGTLTLTGASTYTGVTSINAGVLAVNTLVNGGSNSSIGKASNAAANVVLNSGTLRYTGAASSTNRLFTLGSGGGTLDASGTGALTFSNTGAVAYTGTGNRTLTLTGSNTGANSLAAAIGNPAGNTTSIVKSGAGSWTVSGNNTYSGSTTINEGSFAFGSNTAAGTSVITVNAGTLSASGGERTIANDVVVGGNFSIGGTDNLTFEGSINLGGGSRTITVNNTGITTFAGSVTQPYYSGLIKTGAGTLVLSGDNSYAAPTSINAGTLVLASDTALGQAGIYGHTIASGATLALQGDISVNQAGFNLSGSGVGGNGAIRNLSGNNTLAGSLVLGGATSIVSDGGTLTLTGAPAIESHTLTIGGAGDVTLTGAGYGSGGITKNDTGTLTLSGTAANTFANLSVNAGTVVLSKTADVNAVGGGVIAVGDTSGVDKSAVLRLAANNQIADHATSFTVNTYGTFDLNGFAEGLKTLSGTGRVVLGSSGALTIGVDSGTSTFGGTISGGGSVTKTASGTFTLNAVATYTGGTIVNGGTFRLGASNLLANTGALNVAGGTFDLGAFSDTVGAVTFSSGNITGTGTLSASSFAFTNPDNATIAAKLGGAGKLTKTGDGTLTLTGANSYTGGTAINGGTLALGSSGAIGSSGSISFGGGTLQFSGSNTTDYSSRFATTAGQAFSFDTNSQSVTLASALVSAGGTLTKTGAGTLTLSGSGANTFNGLTTVNAGTLSLNKTAGTTALGGDIAIAGGTLTLLASNQIADTSNITLSSGTFSLNGKNETIQTFTNSGGTFTTGAGRLIGTGATITWSGGTNTINNGGVVEDAHIVITGGTNTVQGGATGGVLQLNSGGAGLEMTGGTLTLDSNNAVAGKLSLNGNVTTHASAVTSNISSSGGGSQLGRIDLNGGARTFTIADGAATNDLVISAQIVGTGGSLIKAGDGTLALSAVNTFTGGVTVNAGTLLATGNTEQGGFKALGNYSSVVAPTTVVTVNSGGTLAVQNTNAGWIDPGTTTTQFLNMSLSGTGADGGGALQAQGGRNTWLGNISLAGDTRIQNTVAGDNATLFLGPYIAPSPTAFELNGHDLEFVGVGDTYISSSIRDNLSGGGAGNITLNLASSTASVYFGGAANTYTGDTTVNSGTLRLLVDPGTNPNAAVLGNLTIGDGIGAAGSATTMLVLSDQIADNSTVTINRDGKLDLSTYSTVETLNGVTLVGGHIDTGTGALYVLGDIDVEGAFTSKIDGQLLMDNFATAARTFNVADGSTLELNANLFGKDYIKTGLGTMIVTADNKSNGYTGLTTVDQGVLNIRNSGALGGIGSGTIVVNGAALHLDNTLSNIVMGAESLTLSGTGIDSGGALNSLAGTNSWAGAVTLNADATIKTTDGSLTMTGSVKGTGTSGQQTLTIAGEGNTTISGPISNGTGGGSLGITKIDSGTLTLNGVDSFTGAIAVEGGTVQLTANNVLRAYQPANGGVGNAVSVASGATFAVSGGNNYTNTIGSVTGTGDISIAASTVLKVANASANTFDGRLTGAGLFEKTGDATFTFSSTANTSEFSFDGTVQVTNGTMEFQGGTALDALFIGELKTLAGTTLFLNESFINVGTLNITGNTILDFGTGNPSILNADNIYIAEGAVLTIRNWSSEVDFLFANVAFRQIDGGGTLAGFNTEGTAPQNQVHFEGDPLSPDGSHTGWINYDYQGYTNWEIRPIPEPSTYGAMLLGGCFALLGWRRYATRRKRSS